jgi:hypothetical protein
MSVIDTPLATRDDLRIAPVTFDLYRDIHKGIRSELFAVTRAAGALDPADESGRLALSQRVRSLAELLDSHAHHEDSVMQGAIDLHVPEVAEQVLVDHAVFDRRVYGLVSLAEAAATARPGEQRRTVHELYLALAAFTGSYLGHIDLEERVIMPALSRALDVAALAAMEEAIVSSIPPAEMARSLSLMLPAMNIEDRVEMLAGMQAGAPAEMFQTVMGLASDVLTGADMGTLVQRLAGG